MILIVKSVPYLVIAAALTCALSACGQKGPLYLPAKPTPVITAPLPTPPAAVPSTAN